MNITNKRSKNEHQKLYGECLCGSVKYEIKAPFRDVVNCYCSECRKTSGNFVSATRVSNSQLNIQQDIGLRWYKNSLSQKGFCQHCGANLFWRCVPDNGKVSIMAGCLQPNNGLKVAGHIFIADKSDFHEITDSAPQYQLADVEYPEMT